MRYDMVTLRWNPHHVLAVRDEQVHARRGRPLFGAQSVDEAKGGADRVARGAGIERAVHQVAGVVQERQKQVKEQLAIRFAADVAPQNSGRDSPSRSLTRGNLRWFRYGRRATARYRKGLGVLVRRLPTVAARTWPSRTSARRSFAIDATSISGRSSMGRRRSSTSPAW